MNEKNIASYAEIKTIIVCENFKREVIGAYFSMKDAADDFMIDESEIFEAIESKKQLLGSGFWSRERGFILDSKIAKMRKAKFSKPTERGKHAHPEASVPVVQLDYETLTFIARYNSMYEAFRFTGARNISKCCKGEAQSSGGFRWMFEEEYNSMMADENNNNFDDLM